VPPRGLVPTTRCVPPQPQPSDLDVPCSMHDSGGDFLGLGRVCCESSPGAKRTHFGRCWTTGLARQFNHANDEMHIAAPCPCGLLEQAVSQKALYLLLGVDQQGLSHRCDNPGPVMREVLDPQREGGVGTDADRTDGLSRHLRAWPVPAVSPLVRALRSRRSFISSPLWTPYIYGPTS